MGAQWGIKSGNIAAFERYMAQLKAYYFDIATGLDESPFMYVSPTHQPTLPLYRVVKMTDNQFLWKTP